MEQLLWRSLRFRMPVIVLLGILPPMLMSLFVASYYAEAELRQDAQENIAFKAEILANTVSWWNQMNVLSLKQVSQQPEIVSMDAERQKPVLEIFVENNQNLYLASTTDLDGLNVARSDDNKPIYYGDRPWFLGVKAGKEITYESLISRTIMKPALCMGVPIQQETLKTVGTLMLCTELSTLAKQIGQLQFGKTGYALLMDKTGQVLAHPNSALLSGTKLEDLSQYPPIKNILEGRSGFFSFKDEQDINWVSYGITLENGWNATIIQQEDEFLQNESEFKNYAYLIALVAVIAVSVLTWLLANRLIRPISQLTTVSKAISEGQLDRRVRIERRDELGTLATSFNQMANRLKTSFNQLEHRVKKRTAELNTAKETAENANQTKDRFLAHISHELRSPLSTIISYATILQEKPNLMPDVVKALKVIRENGIHLLNLIEDIVDFSKAKVSKIEFNPTYIHSHSFLDGVVSMAEMYAKEKQLLFDCQIVGKIATGIWVDEKRLRQVLINLLDNAVKFTEQGRVTLKVSVLRQTERVSATKPYSQQRLRFAVIDTGKGINPKHLEKIFQPFEQVNIFEQQVDGLGLGLAISQQIVEMMGSKLKVKSKFAIGSAFWFDLSLPVTEVLPERKGNRAVKALTPSGWKDTILIVDDREENHFYLSSILKPLGFRIVCAADGQQALEMAPSVKPDLILLDLYMPVKTGFTLVQELQKIPKFETIPIILMSASSYEVVQKASQHLGCNAFLTKPIEKQKLLALLKKCGMLSKHKTF